MRQLKWVFALSIDDELTWALAPVNPDPDASWHVAYPVRRFPHGKIADLPNREPGTSRLFPLRDRIVEALAILADHPEIGRELKKVSAVGISSIGLVDKSLGRLVDVRRKPWVWEAEDCVIDFRTLFKRNLPKILVDDGGVLPLAIQNDATAKCLAHRVYEHLSPHEILCTVMVNDGVNIGVANGSGPISPADLHPELGHGYPRLSRKDERDSSGKNRNEFFAKKSGCPIHITCYEGIASGARIKNEWKVARISDIASKDRKAALETISDYIAQLCWTVTLSLAPHRILICGTSVCDLLVNRVRERFKELNAGVDKPYLSASAYPALRYDRAFIKHAPTFEIECGPEIKNKEALMGALEMARRAASRARYIDLVKPIYEDLGHDRG